ncbi:hypothetical protein AB0K34_21165 [Actinomadura sp. NPDC049382]|uniref:hypothetical protein n=1 Tax=Actinomadura sp. NPDC049382 TaxID=3158220 RepID=UPI0034257D4A
MAASATAISWSRSSGSRSAGSPDWAATAAATPSARASHVPASPSSRLLLFPGQLG